MPVTIAYSAASAPSANKIADALAPMLESRYARTPELVGVELVRDSTTPVLINWGRATANAQLNANTAAVTNKRLMREAFRNAEVPMPALDIWQGNHTFPLVGRPDRHTRGRGYWLVTSDREMHKAMRGQTFRNGTRKVGATHFMEYISRDRAPYEYRVHVFMGRVIRLSRKDFENAADGQHYLTVSAGTANVEHVRNAAVQAMTAVGLDFGAVDILASDSDAWVLEVNSAPGLGGTMPALYAKVFAKWARGQN